MTKKIMMVICPTCESKIKFVEGDPPRRCICCTKAAELKNEADKMRLAGATVVEAGALKVESKGGK
jgi:hypothetical protein